MSTTDVTGQAESPKGLIEAVVNLVETGPVSLGAYTLAELHAVSGVISFLERNPGPELVAEAVRSLAARNLITTQAGSDQIDVRGDLGVALAFQQRSLTVLDARVTGSEPDRPWRFVLMPQPEEVTLEVLIDALGIHFYSLRTTEEAFERLWKRLPSGDRGQSDADADATLTASPNTALISISQLEAGGAAPTTHDVVLAQDGDTCHVFLRDPEAPSQLTARGLDNDEWRSLVSSLCAPHAAG